MFEHEAELYWETREAVRVSKLGFNSYDYAWKLLKLLITDFSDRSFKMI